MSETDDLISRATSCPQCLPGAPKPVLILERYGNQRFFCPQCEHAWDEPRAMHARDAGEQHRKG